MSLDEHLTGRKQRVLQSAVAWWEGKRLLYNAIVGAAGIFVFLSLMDSRLPLVDLAVGTIFYGIGANVLFLAGWVTEALLDHYFRGRIDLSSWRKPMFIIGTLFSLLLTASIWYSLDLQFN